MPGCLGCPISYSTTISGVWTDFRYHYGPSPDSMGTMVSGVIYRDIVYTEDLSDYLVWASAHDVVNPFDDYKAFRKWFSWKLLLGNNSGGNLPSRVRDHIGLSCAPCPYSTECSDIRSTNMVGGVPEIQNDHSIYYMRIEQRGSKWGFVCTYTGCPYVLETGNNYFYV